MDGGLFLGVDKYSEGLRPLKVQSVVGVAVEGTVGERYYMVPSKGEYWEQLIGLQTKHYDFPVLGSEYAWRWPRWAWAVVASAIDCIWPARDESFPNAQCSFLAPLDFWQKISFYHALIVGC